MLPPDGDPIEPHELARTLPGMAPEDRERIAAGLRRGVECEPVTLHEGRILDGRHRYAAHRELGLPCPARDLPAGADPLEFVLARNVYRRHLTARRRVAIASELANLGPGRPSKTRQACEVSLAEAAERLGVSETLVRQYRRIRGSGERLVFDDWMANVLSTEEALGLIREGSPYRAARELMGRVSDLEAAADRLMAEGGELPRATIDELQFVSLRLLQMHRRLDDSFEAEAPGE